MTEATRKGEGKMPRLPRLKVPLGPGRSLSWPRENGRASNGLERMVACVEKTGRDRNVSESFLIVLWDSPCCSDMMNVEKVENGQSEHENIRNPGSKPKFHQTRSPERVLFKRVTCQKDH